MKPARFLLIAVAATGGLLLAAVAVAFNSSFQTWATRRALASRPAWHASVGAVSAGLHQVSLKNVRFEQDGVALVLPSLEAGLPLLSAGLGKKVLVSRLVAKGWVLDLSKFGATPSKATAAAGAPASAVVRNHAGGVAAEVMRSAAAAAVPRAAAPAFAGIFGRLQLPLDASFDGVELEGEVILPEGRGRATVKVTGGGLGAAREGKFDLAAAATLADPGVTALTLRGTLMAVMDSPRSFARLAARLDATASGPKFPDGVKLTSDLSAARLTDGESYAVAVVNQERPLVAVQAGFPNGGRRLDGTWKLDMRETDLAPFALGRPLPAFAASGAGKFDTDFTFAAVHAAGRLDATVDRLAVLNPKIPALGPMTLGAEFDLAQHGEVIGIAKLDATIAAARPVAVVQALQAFEFNARRGELRAADPARELFGITLQGVPLAWIQPFLPDLQVTGGDVHGEVVATARGGGTALRSKTPVTVAGVSVSRAGRPLLQGVDLAVSLAADYTPLGWQAEIANLTLKTGAVALLALEAKAGQLAGKAQPLKATGRFTVDLPALLEQPAGHRAVSLSQGGATVEFVASLAAKQEVQAKIFVTNLAAPAGGKSPASPLPSISADVRADVAASGQFTFNVPILLERAGRKSDIAIVGTLTPGKDAGTLDAQVVSTQLVVDDAMVLVAILPAGAPDQPGRSPPPRETAPPWAGVNGSLALHLKKVIYSDTFQVSDVAGTLRLDAGALKLEQVHAGFGDGSEARFDGLVKFESAAPQPFVLAADFALHEFDPGPLFQAINPKQPPTVEGKFSVTSKLAGRATRLGDLALGAGGDFQLASKGGIFRGLPVNVGSATDSTGKVAGWIASAGTALGALTGRKDYADIANKAQALGELARGLNPIPYDQLSVVLSRDEALNTTLKDFALISPELRLTGSGRVTHQPGAALLDDTLAMEFKLRARGRQGDLLKYLGVLEPPPDALGYVACTLPLKIGGTLGRPDTSELNGRLAALAAEKSGVTDKAADLFNRLRGAGK